MSASWVIRVKATGQVLFETFDARKVAALNTAKYEAVPIGEYLVHLTFKRLDLVDKANDIIARQMGATLPDERRAA